MCFRGIQAAISIQKVAVATFASKSSNDGIFIRARFA
jgi:hypothetical protein